MSTKDKSNKPATNRFDDVVAGELNETERQAVTQLALAVLANRHQRGATLGSPDDTRAFLRLRLGACEREIFGVVLLDNRHRVIEVVELFQGTIDGASVHPRVVVQHALQANAAALLLFHNHPSGVSEPSAADQTITQRLIKALALVDIRVLDHLVVSAGEAVSMAERGLV